MPISHNQLSNLIRASFPNADFKLIDMVGDEDHYSLEISDSAFSGLGKVAQHKMLNKALESCLGGTLHAITYNIKNR